MSHTIDDRIMELADEYTLNHSDEDYLSNKALLTKFKQEMIDKAWEFICEHFVVGMEYDDFCKAME